MEDVKKLVVFYSLSGNTRFIAEEIKRHENADLLELKLDKEVGFLKFVRLIGRAMSRKKPELKSYNLDINNYGFIYIGTPIWASHNAPAINTFLTTNTIENKKIALFCCHAGRGNGRAFKNIKAKLQGNEFVGELEITNPIKRGKDKSIKKLFDWLDKINE
ncbi:flavodoxin [Vallitalea longa]|uniref:Flavodoxin n=1 Tax=Vallitalea longa TaxID=2936439 RepID=A0A9W5YEQ4_9FIRM|nr:flavodoxin [Vallitalea longa]GKX29848.1 flavodoxin [Vallitalea longa]